MFNALAFKSYLTSILRIHLKSFSLVFHHLTLWFLLWSAITSDLNMPQVDDMTSTHMADFGCFWCLFGCSGISGLLDMVTFGDFCWWLLFALISGGLHLGLNFHFIQFYVPCHNECNSTLCKKHSLSMQLLYNKFLIVPYRLDVAENTSSGTLIWQQLGSVRLVHPFFDPILDDKSQRIVLGPQGLKCLEFCDDSCTIWFVQVWFHFHKSCSSLPSYDLVRKKAYIVV